MDKVVNYFLLLIVFVFDPLAIALVVAANMAFAKIRKPDVDFDLDNPTPPNDKLKNAAEKYKEEQKEDNTTEPSESLKQRVKENQLKLKEIEIDEDYFSELQDYMEFIKEEPLDDFVLPKNPTDIPTHDPQTGEVNPYYKELTGKKNPLEEEDEKRMNIIGQNGNDGLHYGNEEYDGDIERLTDTTQTLIVEKKDNIRVIKKDEDLTEEERIELSKEVGKKETQVEEPVNPSVEELEKLAKILSISKKEDDETKRLRYRGR